MSATFWNKRRLKKLKDASKDANNCEPSNKKEAKAALDAKGLSYPLDAKLKVLLALLRGEEASSA